MLKNALKKVLFKRKNSQEIQKVEQMKNHSKQSKDLTPLSLKVRTARYALRRRWLLSAPNEKTSYYKVSAECSRECSPKVALPLASITVM